MNSSRTIVTSCIAVGLTSVAVAEITPIEQSRAVTAFANVPLCQANIFEDHAAKDFEEYSAAAYAISECAMAEGVAVASQQSVIESHRLWSSANSSSYTSANQTSVNHAVCNDGYAVTFTVDQPTRFELTGMMSASVYGDGPIFAHSLATLTSLDHTVYVDIVLQATTGDPTLQLDVREVGVIPPGTYLARFQSGATIDYVSPPTLGADGTYLLQMDLTNYGDINADDTVDVLDLLDLLAAWGPCPATGPCATDLDGDGVTDITDLLIVLGAWG